MALEEAQDERHSSVLIDSDMDFADATDRFQAHSERVAQAHKIDALRPQAAR